MPFLLRNWLPRSDKSPELLEEVELPDALREEAVELPIVLLVPLLSLELPELEEVDEEEEEEALQARFLLAEDRFFSFETTGPACCRDLLCICGMRKDEDEETRACVCKMIVDVAMRAANAEVANEECILRYCVARVEVSTPTGSRKLVESVLLASRL